MSISHKSQDDLTRSKKQMSSKSTKMTYPCRKKNNDKKSKRDPRLPLKPSCNIFETQTDPTQPSVNFEVENKQ